MVENLGNLFIDGESPIEDLTGNHSIVNTGVVIGEIEMMEGIYE